jgi:hypothetical protein
VRCLQLALILGAVLHRDAARKYHLNTSYQTRSGGGSTCVLASAALCGRIQSVVKYDRRGAVCLFAAVLAARCCSCGAAL